MPAVNESPIAATISISPGLKVCADIGAMSLLLPGPFGLHGKRAVSGYGFCTFLMRWFGKWAGIVLRDEDDDETYVM